MAINNGGGASFTNKGAWSGSDAYNPGNVVTDSDTAYLNYQSIAAPTGTPAVDGTAITNNSVNTATIAVPLITTEADDLLCLVVFIQQQSAITVASVADTGLFTWTKRWAETGTNVDIELWTAPATGVYDGTVTATFSALTGGNSSASAVAFGVKTYEGFDPEGSLPYHTTGTTALSVTTTDAPDLGIYVSCNSEGSAPSLATGFTSIESVTNDHGLQNMLAVVGYEVFATALSGHTITPVGGASTNLNIFDAITSENLTNPAPGDDPDHWIG